MPFAASERTSLAGRVRLTPDRCQLCNTYKAPLRGLLHKSAHEGGWVRQRLTQHIRLNRLRAYGASPGRNVRS